MVSLKQEVNVADYFGAVIVFCLFFVIIFVISVTCVLWFCIDKNDEATVIDKVRFILLFFMTSKMRQSKLTIHCWKLI
ncbi:hypothetical protein TTRE_0000508601 [Trichuris trichiura]|uniref:Uncharacterized protein n=1 Tax=Trichuris trichiura TaxID=36087 RepID=A0A077ZAG9_TRITR|nr:hypothetical protein TTRE_0000508601 [Trichuris trichiura]